MNCASGGASFKPPQRRPKYRLTLLLAAGCAVLLVLIGGLLVLSLSRIRGSTAQAEIASQESLASKGGVPIVSGLLPNSCLRFAPSRGDLHHTIFVDAGHGSPDPGTEGMTTSAQTIYEKDAALATALKLRDLLRSEGYTVVMSRVADSSVAAPTAQDRNGSVMTAAGEHDELQARVACANAAHADLLLSIHFNGFGPDHTVGGTQTFYDDARPFSDENLAFAQQVQSNVLSQLAAAGWQIPDRGITADSSLDAPTLTQEAAAYPHLMELGPAVPGWFSQPSQMPGALCEALFLTDPPEADVAASALGQDAMARGFQIAIDQYWQSQSSNPTPTPTPAASPSSNR